MPVENDNPEKMKRPLPWPKIFDFDYNKLLEEIGEMYQDKSVSDEMKQAFLNLELALLQIESIHMKEIAKELK